MRAATATTSVASRFGQNADASAHHVIQGEHKVTDHPDVVLTTILGSCVAACMRDPIAGIGGMNHFLLPGENGGGRPSSTAERYGVHAMELLVNALLERGAVRSRLEAKLFGGAKTIAGFSDVGALNAEFASSFLRREHIKVVGECLKGGRGRRIQYWPITGRARRIFLALSEEPTKPVAQPAADFGALDLF